MTKNNNTYILVQRYKMIKHIRITTKIRDILESLVLAVTVIDPSSKK